MAPHKTPRNKKHHQNVSTPNGNHATGTTSPIEDSLPVGHSETYEKAQEDEREVLKAVFMDDYEEVEAKGAWSVRT